MMEFFIAFAFFGLFISSRSSSVFAPLRPLAIVEENTAHVYTLRQSDRGAQ
jgi:hypothetical protein